MDRIVAARRAMGLGLCLLGTLSMAGCGGTRGFQSTEDSGGSTLGNLLAFNSLHVGPAPTPASLAEPTVDCPMVEVLDGTASMRTYSGAEQANSNVKYQYSLGDVVRECSKTGGQLVLKVGVQGRVLIGPAGTPGSFSAPIRIAIRNDNDQKVVTSKFYTVPVTIQGGESQGDFSLVSDPIAVPFIKASANEDYTILVGFDSKGQTDKAASPRRRAGKRG